METKESIAFFHYLLEKGADIDVPEEDGKTALRIAVERHLDQRVKILLARGANIYAKAKGVSVLMRAHWVSLPAPQGFSRFSAAQQLVQRKHQELLQKEVAELEREFFGE